MGTYIWRITVYIQLYIYCVTSIQSMLYHYNCDLNIFNMLTFTWYSTLCIILEINSVTEQKLSRSVFAYKVLVSREIAALTPSTVLLLTALSISVFQSFTVLGKKECLNISMMAESTLQLANMILNWNEDRKYILHGESIYSVE